MYFSINAYKGLLGLKDSYRLKKDGAFIQQNNFKKFNLEEDMLFHNIYEANNWLATTDKVTINGESVSTNSDRNKFGSRAFEFEVIVHRVVKPKNSIITKEQLRSVLLKGDDTVRNLLFIDFDGFPILKKLGNYMPYESSGMAVRLESYGAKNGYVGRVNEQHIEDTYQTVLEGWDLHLSSGKEIYRDYSDRKKTPQQLIESITDKVSVLQ